MKIANFTTFFDFQPDKNAWHLEGGKFKKAVKLLISIWNRYFHYLVPLSLFCIRKRFSETEKETETFHLKHNRQSFFFNLLATSKTKAEAETEMCTLALDNIHNTAVKETKPKPTSYRVKLNSVSVSVSEKTAFLTFANNLDLK